MSLQDISCAEAKTMIEQGAQLVDVRSQSEFFQGALPDAISLPLEAITQQAITMDKERPVIVYCVTGRRSGMAQARLLEIGFTAVHNLGSFRSFFAC